MFIENRHQVFRTKLVNSYALRIIILLCYSKPNDESIVCWIWDYLYTLSTWNTYSIEFHFLGLYLGFDIKESIRPFKISARSNFIWEAPVEFSDFECKHFPIFWGYIFFYI